MTRVIILAALMWLTSTANADPETTAREYADALSAGNLQQMMQTITFPETQFYQDGRTWTINTAADYPPSLNYPFKLEVLESSILDKTDNLALVRVVMKRTDQAGDSIQFVAWWGMRRIEGGWRIAWRQVVGSDT